MKEIFNYHLKILIDFLMYFMKDEQENNPKCFSYKCFSESGDLKISAVNEVE